METFGRLRRAASRFVVDAGSQHLTLSHVTVAAGQPIAVRVTRTSSGFASRVELEEELMTMNRAGMTLTAVLLGLPVPARAQAANGPCKPVFDAMLEETLTPHHTVTIQGGTQEGESISTADAIYTKVKDVWRRSSMTPQQMLAKQQENIRDVTVAACTPLPDETVDGQRAAVYHTHYEQKDNGSSDARVWIAKATGLPIRSDVSLQADQKASITTRYDYVNIAAPVVK